MRLDGFGIFVERMPAMVRFYRDGAWQDVFALESPPPAS